MSRLLGGKIDAQTRAGFQFYGTLPDIVAGHPCVFDRVLLFWILPRYCGGTSIYGNGGAKFDNSF